MNLDRFFFCAVVLLSSERSFPVEFRSFRFRYKICLFSRAGSRFSRSVLSDVKDTGERFCAVRRRPVFFLRLAPTCYGKSYEGPPGNRNPAAFPFVALYLTRAGKV